MRFRYVAYSLEGGLVKGRLESPDAYSARDEIGRLGLTPLDVAPAKKGVGQDGLFQGLQQVGVGELIRFARQLSTMLGSGGSLPRTLEMLRSETRSGLMRRTLDSVRKTLDEGGGLSTALSQHPRVFGPMFVSVVEVGEYTGRLGPALEQLADSMEKEHDAKQRAIRTMMYPMAIVLLSMLTMGVLVTVAIPPMLKVFEGMDTDIPLMTRMTVSVAEFAGDRHRELILGLAGLIASLMVLRKLPKGRALLDTVQTHTPIIGPLVVSGELARYSRTLAMLLEAGVPLSTAHHMGLNGCGNMALKQAFADAENSLLAGHGLAPALKRHPILPPVFVELVTMGEESNSLLRTMRDSAQAYQRQLEQRLNGLVAALEPASTVVVGGMVGIIAFSMFVPIYSGLNNIG